MILKNMSLNQGFLNLFRLTELFGPYKKISRNKIKKPFRGNVFLFKKNILELQCPARF
jgi:hypothetical protein